MITYHIHVAKITALVLGGLLTSCSKENHDVRYGQHGEYHAERSTAGDLVIYRNGREIVNIELEEEFLIVEVKSPNGGPSSGVTAPVVELSDACFSARIGLILADGSSEIHQVSEARCIDPESVEGGVGWGGAHYSSNSKESAIFE